MSYKNINLLFLSSLFLKKSFKKELINLILFFIFSFTFSVFIFTSSSLEHSMQKSTQEMPDIVVREIKGDRFIPISNKNLDFFIGIKGVSGVDMRVWGVLFFEHFGKNLTIVGVDKYNYLPYLENKILDREILKLESFAITTNSLKERFNSHFGESSFVYVKNDLTKLNIPIVDTILEYEEIFGDDIVLLDISSARDLLDLSNGYSSDIALEIKNSIEIDRVAKEIRDKFPSYRVYTQEEMSIAYRSIFEYKYGFFLALFVILTISFIFTLIQKLSSLDESERREIILLKAIGYDASSILFIKSFVGFFIFLFALICGILISFIYTFYFNAPLILEIFTPYDIRLDIVAGIKEVVVISLFCSAIYLLSSLFPLWKSINYKEELLFR